MYIFACQLFLPLFLNTSKLQTLASLLPWKVCGATVSLTQTLYTNCIVMKYAF